MTDELDDRTAVDVQPARAHGKQTRELNFSSRYTRPKTFTYEEQHEQKRSEIARLYETGRIKVIEGREYFEDGVKEEFDRLWREYDFLETKVDPRVVFGRSSHHIHHNGVSYSFTPYAAYEWEFLDWWNAEMPAPMGPHAKRDRILRLCWHFRKRALIRVGQLENKVRGGLSECADCNHRHRSLSRRNGCPRCGSRRYRDVTSWPVLKELGRITKLALQRRFKVDRHQLERILSFTPTISPPLESQGE